MGGKCGGAQRE
jgi:hypothetical protein